jgi:hypothetical protein
MIPLIGESKPVSLAIDGYREAQPREHMQLQALSFSSVIGRVSDIVANMREI